MYRIWRNKDLNHPINIHFDPRSLPFSDDSKKLVEHQEDAEEP